MDEPTYTVFVRVPIPRRDFVDPPPVSCCDMRALSLADMLTAAIVQVNWDSSKDDALWKILSGAAQTEIDCKLLIPIYRPESANALQGMRCTSVRRPGHITANHPHAEPTASTFPSTSFSRK